MASASKAPSLHFLLLLLLLLAVASCSSIDLSEARSSTTAPPIAKGLSLNFYSSSCPNLESIVRNRLKKVVKDDVGQAAGLLRLHFHDCFVLGCDASLLLDGSAGGPNEKIEIPNLTLRASAFKIIEDLRKRVHKECGRVVSCSDIITLAARDSVVLTGGPDYAVPLGRRDGLRPATQEEVFGNLRPPSATADNLIASLATKNLDPTDVVALSGAHTIGISHCSSFTDRLYPNQDPTMDKTFANNLKRTCPALDTNRTVNMDIRSPNVFDNKYYVDLMNRQGLFTSDQDLYTDRRTRAIVTDFAVNQNLFYEKFINAMLKMGQLNVTTGNRGEIRAKCSKTNSNNWLSSFVEKAEEMLSSF